MASPEAGGGAADLHTAARAGDVSAICSMLAAEPQSVNDRDRHSRTPLHLAAWAGQAEAVRVLCERNADVGAAAADDMAAIHFACQKGHAEVARLLLAAGAHLNSRTRKGMTPLHYAAQGRHEDTAKLLIKRGANLLSQNKAGKRPGDLARDEGFLAVLEAAAEERRSTEAKRKEQKKAAQAVATRPELTCVPSVEEVDKEDESAPAVVIGPSLPTNAEQRTEQEEEPAAVQIAGSDQRDGKREVDGGTEESTRPSKKSRLDGTEFGAHEDGEDSAT